LVYQTRFEAYVWAPTRRAAERRRDQLILSEKSMVRLLLADGRCSCDSICVGWHGRLRTTPLAYAAQGLRYAEDRAQRSRLSDCVRALVTKDPRLADCSFTLHPADKLITRTAVILASTYACLEMLYVLLLALRDFWANDTLGIR